MAEKKRGLHRGLEALLVDTTLPKIHPSPAQPMVPNEQTAIAAQLTKAEQLIAVLRQENHLLQQEAAMLADLLHDVESLLYRIEQE